MDFLFHATSTDNAALIRKKGMMAGSYWGKAPLAHYYRETVYDEGKVPAFFAIDISTLQVELGDVFEPDWPGIEEPISTVVGLKEEDIHARWEALEAPGWRDSIDLIGSLRCASEIDPKHLTWMTTIQDIYDVDDLEETELLTQRLSEHEWEDQIYAVQTLHPEDFSRLIACDGTSNPLDVMRDFAEDWQFELIAQKAASFDEDRILVCEGNLLVDGNHHLCAAAQIGKPIHYIDLEAGIAFPNA